MPDQRNRKEGSSFNQPPTVPPRDSSRNLQARVCVSNRSEHGSYPNAIVSANEPWTVQGGSNLRPALRINTNNFILQPNYNIAPSAAAPKIESREQPARPQELGYTTPQHLPQQDGNHTPRSALRRSNAVKVTRSGTTIPRASTTVPRADPEMLPEHPQATLINGLNRLTKQSPYSSPLPGSKKKRSQTMGNPVKSVIRGLAGLGKRVFSRTVTLPVKSQSIKAPQYILKVNRNNQVPLLTLEYKRCIKKIPDRMPIEALARTRETLRVFKGAFRGDLPEHRFPRGQDQVDVVARYLMSPCTTLLDDSEDTQFARHSAISLRAWQAYVDPDGYPPLSKDSKPHQRWNMIEARRRVRTHNRVIEEFRSAWDSWVAAQKPDIRLAAARDPESDEVPGGIKSPFRNFYHWMLIACDEEIKLRQDIGEALILQYPSCFPGFKKGESI